MVATEAMVAVVVAEREEMEPMALLFLVLVFAIHPLLGTRNLLTSAPERQAWCSARLI